MLRLLFIILFWGCVRSSGDSFAEILFLQFRLGKVTLVGQAIKGAYKSALVEAYPVTQEGNCDLSNLLSKDYTDSYGKYSLSYPRTSSLVCVKVKPDPQGRSLLYDEKTKSDVSVPASSGLTLDMVVPETNLEGRKNPLATSPISRIVASRFAHLAKGNTDSKELVKLYRRASKEMVIRFGLNKKAKLSKNLSGDEVPTLEEIPINWNDPKDPYAISYLSVLAGFSQLASSQKQGSTVSASDINSIIEVFAKDASDGVFDGKDASGTALTFASGQALGTDPLTNHLATAVQTFFQEGGSLGTTSNTQVSVNVTELVNSISFNGVTPISFSDAPSNSLPTVSFSGSSATYLETAGTISIPVSLSESSVSPVTVTYSMLGGSATSGLDYTFTPGTLTFAAGETTKSIPITILYDSVNPESDETIVITLSSPTNATLGAQTSYTVTIQNVPPPTVTYPTTDMILVKDQALTFTPTISGTITSCSLSPIPSGLSINSTTCEITGTPDITQIATPSTVSVNGGQLNVSLSIEVLGNIYYYHPSPPVYYRLSTLGQNCTSRCVNHGGTTIDHYGTSTNSTNCSTVLTTLLGTSPSGSSFQWSGAYPCMYQKHWPRYIYSTGGGGIGYSDSTMNIVCPCTN